MGAAIKIRKVGYGYRISYEDFGEMFWPIIGQRIWEDIDQPMVEFMFNKAAELNKDQPEIASILAVGDGQAWKCGVTKLFIKDEVRYALEATLNRHRNIQATRIQTAIRGKLGREVAKKRLAARTMIQENVLKWIQLKRWRKQLMQWAGKFTEIVVRIQRNFRGKREREKFMAYLRRRKEAAKRI